MTLKRIIIFLILVLGVNLSLSQNLEDRLVDIIQTSANQGDYIKNYVQPLALSLGIVTGSGLYNHGVILEFPHFRLGAGYTVVHLPDKARFFYDPATRQKSPSIFGDKSGPIPGFDKSHLPIWIIQGNIGLLNNLELNLRYSYLDDSMMGKVSILGGGMKYGLSELFIPKSLPLNLSVQAAYHYLLAKEYLASGSFNMNLNSVYKIKIMPLSLTAAIALNNSTLVVRTDELKNINDHGIGEISVTGENGVRYHFGMNIDIWKVILSSDFSFGTYQALFFGLTAGF